MTQLELEYIAAPYSAGGATQGERRLRYETVNRFVRELRRQAPGSDVSLPIRTQSGRGLILDLPAELVAFAD